MWAHLHIFCPTIASALNLCRELVIKSKAEIRKADAVWVDFSDTTVLEEKL